MNMVTCSACCASKLQTHANCPCAITVQSWHAAKSCSWCYATTVHSSAQVYDLVYNTIWVAVSIDEMCSGVVKQQADELCTTGTFETALSCCCAAATPCTCHMCWSMQYCCCGIEMCCHKLHAVLLQHPALATRVGATCCRLMANALLIQQ